MKEYHLNPEMDRNPAVSGAEKRAQAREVEKDEKILNAWKHGQGCGCGGCKGHAIRVREALRPEGSEPKKIAPPSKINRPPTQ